MLILLKHEQEKDIQEGIWGTDNSQKKQLKMQVVNQYDLDKMDYEEQLNDQNLYLNMVSPIVYVFQSK